MREVHGLKAYQCRCGHRCACKSNYIRHLKTCKLRRGLQDAQQACFVCRCGEQQAEVGLHMAHIADCGLQRASRPASGSHYESFGVETLPASKTVKLGFTSLLSPISPLPAARRKYLLLLTFSCASLAKLS